MSDVEIAVMLLQYTRAKDSPTTQASIQKRLADLVNPLLLRAQAAELALRTEKAWSKQLLWVLEETRSHAKDAVKDAEAAWATREGKAAG